MTLQQLDDVLKTWQGRLSAMAENLLQLQEEANYRSLTGEGGLSRAPLHGVTAARVGPAIGSVHRLFESFGALQSTIDQAASLRGELPAFFGAEAKAREIHRLLFSPSISLEADSRPLANRGLLAADRPLQAYTPEEVMQRMAVHFASVRDAVDAAGQAWTAFGDAAERLELDLARLRSQTAVPTALLAPALDAVQAQLVPLTVQAQTDPLGALTRVQQEVEPALARVDRQVNTAMALAAQLRAAQVRCEDLRSARVSWQKLSQQRDRTIAPVPGQDVEGEALEAKIEALAQWHRRLEGKRDGGALDAVAIGLRNWSTAAEKLLQQTHDGIHLCKRQLAQREELRGRLRALKAKARANQDSSPIALLSLGAEAERLVLSEPIALEAATAALTHFEDQLRMSFASVSQQGVNRG